MTSKGIPDSFVIHSGMRITYADPVFCTLLGVESQEQLVGRSLTDVVIPEYHSELREQVTRIENEDEPVLGLAVELQMPADQSQRVIIVNSLMRWDNTQQVQASVLPIVEPDSTVGRLLRSAAMDEAPFGISISDPSQPDNPLIYVNDGFCELTGYPRDEILGQNCRFLQGESTREKPVAQMRAAIEAEEPVTVKLRNYRSDGTMFWNRVTIVPIRSGSGTVTNYLGYQKDVTTEKRFEQDLTLFKKQAEGSEEAIFITDPDGTIQYVNPAFEQMTGYTATEANGRNPSILKSGQQDDAFYADLWEQITAGDVWEAELTNQTKQGELFEVTQKIIPATGKDGNTTQFVAIMQDIGENLLTKQTLDVLNRVVRHNLRNSVSVIDGHAKLLASDKMDEESRQASIEAIRDQATSMQKIAETVDGIREVFAMTDDDQTWNRLNVETLFEAYQNQYADAEITASIDGDGTIYVRNADLLEQAIDEAVENAVKHSDQSSPDVSITVDRESDADYVYISVADNGPRIPDLERRVIESGEETPLQHSLGIGLWMMEWVITTLGGELTISDNDPRGSVVTFQLPSVDQSIVADSGS
ncbi:PAS domain-containing protein [Natronomonas sp. LN261]|uniref:PAS domain-containing protein n=1 Tax=Natronomonas sp. LN261 TaxID=2750669 RepID=UPI0015EF5D16|nr:PAS domain-containing protein [Natronomonas sp. LN261]